MSQQERVSWLSLLTTLLIGYWYFQAVLALPADANLHGPAMARLVTRLVVVAIAIGVAGELLLRMVHGRSQADGPDATSADERDALIHLKATRNAHFALGIGVILVLCQIAMLELTPHLAARIAAGTAHAPDTLLQRLLTGPLSALHVAQLLLLALTLASITLYGSRVLYYRRGY
jgi:hypothetical protein